MKTLIQLLTILTFISCSAQQQLTEGQRMREELHHVTSENRNVVGHEKGIILKNRIYYKVTDSKGNPAPKIYEPDTNNLIPIGGILILKDEYRFQH